MILSENMETWVLYILYYEKLIEPVQLNDI